MDAVSILSGASLVMTAGLGIYFVSRRILGGLAVAVMTAFTLAVTAVSMRSGIWVVAAGYDFILVILCVMCAAYEVMMPAKPHVVRRRKHHDTDDGEDEYISVAPTMSVRQIVREYTRDPAGAEARYTDRPMNVTGVITRITTGGKYSHVELDEMFMCVCPQGSVRSLKPFQKVCITGTLRGKLLLDDCVMVKYPL